MGRSVVLVFLLSGCSCEPIDLSGCEAAFSTAPCEDYTFDGVDCVPSRYTCPDSICQCSASYVVVCPADMHIPHDLSQAVRDLTLFDDGGSDDGGSGDGG